MAISGNGSITGRGFYDADGDDRFGSGDYAAANFPITVQATDAGGQVVASTVTGADGLYTLDDLADGLYTLAFSVPPAALAFTPSAPADAQRTITIVDGQAVTGADAGFILPSTVTGTAYDDANGNGLFDYGEAPVGGETVRLPDGHGPVVATTTTGSNGVYSFTNLHPGAYAVAFTAPAGDVSTSPTTVNLGTVLGNATATANSGLVVAADSVTISGTAFADADGNGRRGAGEAGMAGVNVMLVRDAGTATATVVKSSTTDAAGHCTFAGLSAGDYAIVFATPSGDVGTGSSTRHLGPLAAGQSSAAEAGFAADPTPDAGPLRAATTVNIILRGQSNATYFTSDGYLTQLKAQVEHKLGFDGVHQTVNFVADFGNFAGLGINTLNPGTGIIRDWLSPIDGDFHNGWTAKHLEIGLLTDVERRAPTLSAGQTMILWLHNESDSLVSGLTSDEWMSAARYETGLVRAALGKGADEVPLLFVNAIPFPASGVPQDSSDFANQNIRIGMAALAADKTFNAAIVAQLSDVTMDRDGTINGAHLNAADNAQLLARLTLSLAETLAASALPGSPVALDGGQLDSIGPQVVAATAVDGHPDQLLLTITHDHVTGFDSLGTAAAAGVGWSVRTTATGAGSVLQATGTAVTVVNGTHLLVTFDAAVPTDGKLFYAWGDHRLAADPTLPGNGNAVYDSNHLPIWANANGVGLTVAPAGSGSVSGTVFGDANGNDALDASDGDAGFQGYTVLLKNAGGTTIAAATSDANGAYSFVGLADGTYTVAFADTSLGVFSGVAPGTHAVTIAGGQAAPNVDAGFYQGGAIYGFGYADANHNGAFDIGEGIDGETVELLDGSGLVVATTTTSGSNPALPVDGAYVFQGLAEGPYSVRFTQPAGTTLTTAATVAVTLPRSQVVEVDSGLQVNSGGITGTVFTDTDGNGEQNGSEAGLGGLAVTLTDGSGHTVGTTTSDGQGRYGFAGVPAGTYGVSVTPPGGQTAEPPLSVTIGAQTVTGRNIGVYAPEPIAGFVNDSGGSAIDGATVLLIDAGGHVVGSTISGPNPSFPHGVYQFFDVKPGAYTVKAITGGALASITTQAMSGSPDYGQNVQLPAAAPVATAVVFGFAFNDANGNGLLDPGENPVDGETVELLNHDRDPIASTQTGPNASFSAVTGLDGAYSFTGVTPGTYTLRFTAPTGEQLTTSVLQSLGTVTAGQAVIANSGLVSSAGTITVAGTAFDDTNGDGQQGTGETGHAGVNVLLVKDAGTSTAVALRTAVTGSDGHYTFGALAAGTYSVVFATPSGSDPTSPTTVAAGALITGQSATANLGLHADATPNAAPIVPTTVINVIIRGQSNAQNFSGKNVDLHDDPTAIATMRTDLEHLLGFDGVHQRVNLLADAGNANGVNTINSGTALLTDWLQPINGDYHNGWTAKALELGLLTDVAQQSAAFRSAPTAVVWLHNESDSVSSNLTTDMWTSAARVEAGLLRGVLGQDASTVPYLFVNAIPFGGNDNSEQAIRIGMTQLAADPLFNGRIAAQLSDVAEDEFGTAPLGGHIDDADRQLLAGRLAVSLAQTFASSALPGSPVALAQGQIDDKGPQVVDARMVAGHANQLVVTVQRDVASGFKALNTAAAQGVGWTIRDGALGTAAALKASATSAEILDPTHLRITFDHDVGPGARLFYAWGTGLIAKPGQSGFGNAVYDTQNLPIWTDPNGVGVVSGAAVVGVAVSGAGVSASGAGHLRAGAALSIAVSLDTVVRVDTSHGVPTLTLNDGATATYSGGSGTHTLSFGTTVAAGQNSPDLAVTAFDLHGGTVRDAGGTDAVLGGAVVNPGGVLVIDTGTPILSVTAPPPTLQAASAAGAAVSFTGTATDAVDGTDAVVFREGTRVVASGDTFGVGRHTITASAQDAAGNAATPIDFAFTVAAPAQPTAETGKPVLTLLSPAAVIEATSAQGAVVTFAGSAADAVDGTDPMVFREGTRVVTSGQTFALGTHTVTASATDAAGNAADPTSFSFTVVDTTRPILGVSTPAAVIEATSSAGAVVTFSGAAADAVDGSDPVTFREGTKVVTSGQTFGLGPHLVTASATDTAGNVADAISFAFTVGDTTKPVSNVTSPPATVTAATAAGASVAFAGFATDGVDGTDGVAFTEGTRAVASGDVFGIGAHTVTASAHDRAGNAADPVAFSFTVVGNHAPHAADDAGAVAAHAAVTGNLLANDADPDAGDHLGLATAHFANAAGAKLAAGASATLASDHGYLTLAADGSYSFLADRAGSLAPGRTAVDTFTYTLTDDHGATDTGHLSLTVTGAAQVASETFAFAFTDARVVFRGESAVLTGPDGVAHDVTGVGSLRFTDGTIQEKDGAPLLDDLYYDARNLDVWRAHVDPDAHYAATGWHEGRDPNAAFSTSAYLAANPDVARAGVDPLQHYDHFGWHEGRSTGSGFSGDAYLAANPDVARSGMDPLAHYLAFGQAEGRFAFPGQTGTHLQGDFDAAYYLAHNPDVAAAVPAGGNADVFALHHYLAYGANEGRDPDAYFSTQGYLAANPDVAAAHANPLLHYEAYGWQEGRDPGPGFHGAAYLAANPDVAAAQIDPLQHFLQFGQAEGRHAA